MNIKKQQGFTLIELMIVVVTIALLATIAYPSYARYVRQTRLAAVRTDLLKNAQKLERYYTQKRTFKNFKSTDLIQNTESLFEIKLNNNINTDVGFELTATPKNANEKCVIHLSDSGVFWATTDNPAATGNTEIPNDCPGYTTM